MGRREFYGAVYSPQLILPNNSKPGASGSPLYDNKGHLAGILRASNVKDKETYYIPASVIKYFLDECVAKDKKFWVQWEKEKKERDKKRKKRKK